MASIDHLHSGQPINTTRSNQNTLQKTSVGSSPKNDIIPPNNKDAFSLSNEGRVLGAKAQQMSAEPHFDSAKVAEIKAAIANGSYKIDADKLAENMLKHEDELYRLS